MQALLSFHRPADRRLQLRRPVAGHGCFLRRKPWRRSFISTLHLRYSLLMCELTNHHADCRSAANRQGSVTDKKKELSSPQCILFSSCGLTVFRSYNGSDFGGSVVLSLVLQRTCPTSSRFMLPLGLQTLRKIRKNGPDLSMSVLWEKTGWDGTGILAILYRPCLCNMEHCPVFVCGTGIRVENGTTPRSSFA